MKKLFIILGAAALVLASCAKSETVVKETPGEMTIKMVSNPVTKADPENTTTGAFNTDNSVVIYAAASSTTDATYFENTWFAYVDGAWRGATYSTAWAASKVYWPMGKEKVDFLAVADAKANIDALAPAFNDSRYANEVVVSGWDTYSNQYDLLYAATNAQTSQTASGVVPLSFKHAQALICFTIKAADDATAAAISDVDRITINGLEYSGTFTVNNANTTLSAKWSSLTSANKDIYTTSNTIDDYNQALTTSAVQCGAHLLVPEQEAKSMTVKYTMGGTSYNYELSIPRETWKMGYKYIYNITFTATEITVTPTVVAWTEDANAIAIPTAY